MIILPHSSFSYSYLKCNKFDFGSNQKYCTKTCWFTCLLKMVRMWRKITEKLAVGLYFPPNFGAFIREAKFFLPCSPCFSTGPFLNWTIPPPSSILKFSRRNPVAFVKIEITLHFINNKFIVLNRFFPANDLSIKQYAQFMKMIQPNFPTVSSVVSPFLRVLQRKREYYTQFRGDGRWGAFFSDVLEVIDHRYIIKIFRFSYKYIQY